MLRLNACQVSRSPMNSHVPESWNLGLCSSKQSSLAELRIYSDYWWWAVACTNVHGRLIAN